MKDATSIAASVQRFLLHLVLASGFFFAYYYLRGRGVERSVTEGLLWGTIVATIILVTMLYKARSKTDEDCVLCIDDSSDAAEEDRLHA